MYITNFESGTSAILNIIKSARVDRIIIAEDMCPDVIKSIIDCGVEVFLAPVERLGVQADYLSIYNIITKIDTVTAILFSHSYGVYDSQRLLETKAWLTDSDFIINDCCLCNPLDLIVDHRLHLPAVFSFGYSKVIDLDYGGLLASEQPVFFEENFRYVNYKVNRLEDEYNLRYSVFKSITNHEFYETEFYNEISRYSARLKEHKKPFQEFLIDNMTEYRFIYSEWRFVVFTKLNTDSVVKLKSDAKRYGVFIGSNYPINEIAGEKVRPNITRMDKEGWPINVFTDFRVDSNYIEKTLKFIEGMI